MAEDTSHYDKDYFTWQSTIGEFGGWANLSKFSKYINKEDTVIDFGCGGGYLLNNIDCSRKIGIEINEHAAQHAKSLGIEVYNDLDKLNDEIADVIISNHALEHVERPLDTIKQLKNKLKSGGTIIVTVPCESIHYKYEKDDINRHLYTWSPMNLGHLFDQAGYTVIESKAYRYKWFPLSMKLGPKMGRRLFDIGCSIYDRLRRYSSQVRIIAKK
jgi:SAM-dependent methyltransferase